MLRFFLNFIQFVPSEINSFRLPENDIDAMETLVKENHLLKQQLQNCFTKVAKTQKVSAVLTEHTNDYQISSEM